MIDMDYEKKYKDALSRARSMYESQDDAELAAYIFPELRESEDERIREEIISALKFANDGGVYDKHIAYLEKQKDASKAIEAVDRIDKYIDEHLANAHDMKDSNPDKKYYRGWDDALGKMAGILQDVYSDEKQKEQKPTDRFEEAREKYQVEWSDNDDQLIGFIFDLLNDLAWRKDWAMSKEECLERLKSLTMRCPKSSDNWRPSEEQMDSLRDTIVQTKGYSYSIYLPELYEQLKKLI